MENFVISHSDPSSHHHHGGFVAASLASPVMEPLSLRLSFLHKMLPNCLLLLLFSQLLATATFVYGFCWISLFLLIYLLLLLLLTVPAAT